jgi:acyl carrier protein
MTLSRGATRRIVEQLLSDLLELDGDIDWSLIHYHQTPQWDSLVHMVIINELETILSINLSPEDVTRMCSIDDILRILQGEGVVVE